MTETTTATTATPTAKPNTAPIKWAQRDEFLYVTVTLQEVTDESIQFTEQSMTFKGTSKGKYYESKIDFYQPIVPDESAYKIHPLGVEMIVKKAEKDKRNDGKEGFWPQLCKEKHQHGLDVTVDWNHYVDEDDIDGDNDDNPFAWHF